MLDKISVVNALQTAVPFVDKFKGATFVLKLGGSAIRYSDTLESILEQVKTLHILGMRIVIVHGGGEQATDLASRLGSQTQMVNGRRVTDDSALEAVQLTLNGRVNTNIVSVARKIGLTAQTFDGASANLVTALKRPPVEIEIEGAKTRVDFGHVGDIVDVSVDALIEALDAGRIPVVSPLSADPDGNLLNVNADTVAAALAGGLKADKLIYMSSPRGLMSSLDDSLSLISLVDIEELKVRIASGEISDGMLPKVASAMNAIDNGVPHAHFISHDMEHSLLLEVLTSEGCGTMIVADGNAYSQIQVQQ